MACSGLGAISAAQINGAAAQLGIPCSVVKAQLAMESGGQLGLTSSAGAQGPWQFLPSTYNGLGCSAGGINDPVASTACYVKYMGQLLKQEGGSVRNALAAYNAGPGNIQAGMGYANSILSAAGQSGGLTGSGGSGGGGGGGGGSGGGGGGGGGSGGGGGGSGGGPGEAFFASGYTSDVNPLQPGGIETASFLGDIFSTVLDPFKEVLSAESDLASFFANPFVSFLDVFKTLVTGVNALIGGFKTILHDVLWLFNPTHWVRVFCFVFGLFVAVPAAYALMHTGTGDMYLAMGIFLTTLAGILFFLAFHNLPYIPPTSDNPRPPASSHNVISFQALLGYISEGIRSGAAPGSGTQLDAYTLGGTSAPPTSTLLGMFSPDSGGSGSPSGGAATYQPVQNATGIFPTISNIFPTLTGNPPISDIFTGQA